MVQGLVIDAGEHPIKAVTIFKSNRAEIVRTFNVDLKVQLIPLPPSPYPNTFSQGWSKQD